MIYWLLFFFIAFGAKLLLGLVMVYLLLPSDGNCSHCDEETLLIRPNRFGRFWFALTLGRVRLRWCPRCGWEGLARHDGGRRPTAVGAAMRPRKTPTIP